MYNKGRIKARLKEKKPVYGTFLKLTDPSVMELLGFMGYDFAIIDTEHVAMNPETITNLVRAAKAASIEPIIRVRTRDASNILGALDCGASGIQVPNVDTEEDLKLIIERTFYYPKGKRGFATTSRAANYGLMDKGEYVEHVNMETVLVCHCETVESIKNLEKMSQYSEIDAFFIGPMDMSQSVGAIGKPDDPKVQEAISDAIKILNAAKKPFGTVVSNVDALVHYRDMGMQYVVLGSDYGFLINRGKELLKSAKEAFSE